MKTTFTILTGIFCISVLSPYLHSKPVNGTYNEGAHPKNHFEYDPSCNVIEIIRAILSDNYKILILWIMKTNIPVVGILK